MNLQEIYNRIESLVLEIRKKTKDQNCVAVEEDQLAYLEELRESLEEGC